MRGLPGPTGLIVAVVLALPTAGCSAGRASSPVHMTPTNPPVTEIGVPSTTFSATSTAVRDDAISPQGGGFPIPSGRATTFNVKLARDTSPNLDPILTDVSVSPGRVAPGGSTTFTLTLESSQEMSDEVIAASGKLGRTALFTPVGGGRDQATFTVPPYVPPGTYNFAFFGATEQCEENNPYRRVAPVGDAPGAPRIRRAAEDSGGGPPGCGEAGVQPERLPGDTGVVRAEPRVGARSW
jgi:hypothetical protein